VLTCEEEAKAPFTVVFEEGQAPTFLSATGRITADEPTSTRICGDLTLNLSVAEASPGTVAVHVPITNNGEFEWRGTVALRAGDTTVPIDIGSIKPGVTEKEIVEVKLSPGTTQLDGSLLIGP
jgi:hypothetical protein